MHPLGREPDRDRPSGAHGPPFGRPDPIRPRRAGGRAATPVLAWRAMNAAKHAATHAVALDLGGTDLKFARISRDGSVLEAGRTPSRAMAGADALLGVLSAAARRFAAGACGVGLGCPGVLDPLTGALVDETPHLSLPRDFPLAERLARESGLAVHADNDANLAALGESLAGAAKGARLGHDHGRHRRRMRHRRRRPRAARCVGRRGRDLARGARRHGAGVRVRRPGLPRAALGGEGLVLRAREAGLAAAGARDVFDAAAKGDSRAAALVEAMTGALGRQIALVVQVVNPDVVVIGGGVANAGEAWLEAVRAAVRRCAQPSHLRGLRIVPALLGNRAGVVGAGLFAWRRLEGR